MRSRINPIGVIGILLVSVSVLLAVLVVIIGVGDTETSVLESVVGAIAILSGLSGVFLGVSSLSNFKLDNVREYFTKGDDSAVADFRDPIYKHYEEMIVKMDDSYTDSDIDNKTKGKYEEAVKKISAFYHLWGMLAVKKYLPMWPFESSSGISVIKLFQGSIDYIVLRRKDNKLYAEYFEKFYDLIIKKYGKEFAKIDESININITIDNYSDIIKKGRT